MRMDTVKTWTYQLCYSLYRNIGKNGGPVGDDALETRPVLTKDDFRDTRKGMFVFLLDKTWLIIVVTT